MTYIVLVGGHGGTRPIAALTDFEQAKALAEDRMWEGHGEYHAAVLSADPDSGEVTIWRLLHCKPIRPNFTWHTVESVEW